MTEPEELEEFEPLEPWGENFDDEYFDGEDLDLDALYQLEELDEDEWETF